MFLSLPFFITKQIILPLSGNADSIYQKILLPCSTHGAVGTQKPREELSPQHPYEIYGHPPHSRTRNCTGQT